MATRPAAIGHGLIIALAVGLVACKPTAFAAHESEALRTPPAQLRVGQRAYWNDVGARQFGMFELGAGVYRYANHLCKIAEETVIDAAAHTSGTRAFLYCGELNGVWTIEPSVVCRPVRGAASATCRVGGGASYVTLPPA